MSYFKKARNYTKSSTSLDEKIAKANREYEKTGVDSVELVEIANSTSGVYYAGIDHPEEPAVQSDVPDSNGFRDRDPNLPAENASDIDPSDPSTWETGGQGMDHLINPNDLPVIHGDNGVETQSTVTDQPILLTPDLTGFKHLLNDPNDPGSGMGQYGGMAYTYLQGVWGRTEGVIGPGNKFKSVLLAFGWPTGPAGDSQSLGDDYPSDRSYGGIYRYDDDKTYAARLKMRDMFTNGLPTGSYKPVKCWMPFNSYGFGQTWTQYTSNPNNIWRANGDAYVQVMVFDGANQYNSSETVPPYTTVIFKDDLGKGENLPIGGLLGDLLGKLFGIGGSAAEDLAFFGGGPKEPKWPKPGTLSGNRIRSEAGYAQDGAYPGGEEAFYDKYGYTPQEAIDAYNNGGTPPDQSSSGSLPDGTQVASHDKNFSKYPAAGGSDKWPGLPADKLDYLHPSKDPLLYIKDTPFGIKGANAGGDGSQVASAPQTSPFPSDPASDASSSLGVKDGDQLAFNWGNSGTPSTDKKLGHGADTNAVNYANTNGEMGELPDGWTDQDLQDYLDNRGKGFPDQSSIDAGLPSQMVAALNKAQMPQYVKDSIKRQYSGKDYSIEDKKNILNWQQKMKVDAGGSDWTPSSGVQVASTDLSGLFGSSGTGSGSTGQLNLPSWFSGYGNAKNAKLDADGRIYGYNYSGGYGYLSKGPGSGDPGTAESGYGTKGFNWDTQSGGTSWTFTRHDPSKVASGEGGSPGQPYVPPKEDPKNPWVPAPGKEVAAGPGYIPPYVQDWEKLGGGGKSTGTHPWEKKKKGGKIQASSGDSVGDVALNQGPSTPVKNYDGKFLPNMGGGRPGNIRPKGGAALPQAKKDDTGRGGKGNNFGMGSAVVTKGKKKKKTQVVAASNEITGVFLNESTLLMEKNYLRDLREKKREKRKVGDKVMKINITGPKDHLTVKAIDMLRQYKVSEREMQEYAIIISNINQWIRENPKEYEIWKVRYPANDPRTAELNWKLDQQLKASDEYMDSHFPENERLFGKLRQKIATNVDITDPRNFVDVKPAVTHKQLLKVSKAIGESTWKPLDSKVANKTTQTFGLIGDFGLPVFDQTTGQDVTANVGGLGGVEGASSQVTYGGEAGTISVSPPNYTDLALAGYAKPLPWKMARKKNAKKAKQINSQLDSSEDFTKEIKADALMQARVEEWQEKLKEVQKYNESIRRKIEALEERGDKIKRRIMDKYRHVIDHGGMKSVSMRDMNPALPCYPNCHVSDERIQAEYMAAGGRSIERDIAALEKQRKKEPPSPVNPNPPSMEYLMWKFSQQSGQQSDPNEVFENNPIIDDPTILEDPNKVEAILDQIKDPEIKEAIKEIMSSKVDMIAASAKVFGLYLAGKLDVINNEVVGDKYMDQFIKTQKFQNIDWHATDESAGTYVTDGIVGTAPLPTYKDGMLTQTAKFGFNTNAEEMSSNWEKGVYTKQGAKGIADFIVHGGYTVLGELIPALNYSIDANVDPLGPGGPVAGVVASTAITSSKMFGGAKDVPVKLTYSVEELKKKNKEQYDNLVLLGIIPSPDVKESLFKKLGKKR